MPPPPASHRIRAAPPRPDGRARAADLLAVTRDLFLGFRESPTKLSFGADDWALTADPKVGNAIVGQVKDRVGVQKGDRWWHGVIDVIADKTADNGVTLRHRSAARRRSLPDGQGRDVHHDGRPRAGAHGERLPLCARVDAGVHAQLASAPAAGSAGLLDDFVAWLRGAFGTVAGGPPVQTRPDARRPGEGDAAADRADHAAALDVGEGHRGGRRPGDRGRGRPDLRRGRRRRLAVSGIIAAGAGM